MGSWKYGFAWVAAWAILNTGAGEPESFALIPQPQKIQILGSAATGSHDGWSLTADASPAASRAAAFLSRENSWRMESANGRIRLRQKSGLMPEGYQLTIQADGQIILEAADYGGFFNASRTLLQLLSAGPSLPALRIEDAPRFRWRGIMLDTARHFADLKFLKRTIDRMSEVKLNVLHLHFCDDQGWRMEIAKYPKLTTLGAWRSQDPWGFEPQSLEYIAPDGRYGGFYTRKELQELVAYAAERNIEVVPEVEIPAHSSIPVKYYPELVRCNISRFSNVYCAGKLSSMTFIQDLLLEVMAVFPSRYIHIGFDERRAGAWESCPDCQARLRRDGLADTAAMQRVMAVEVNAFLKQHGRRAIGWDEIIQGGPPLPEVTVTARFIDPRLTGVKPALAGCDMIMTTSQFCYLDFAQGEGEPKAPHIGADLSKVYSFEPIPEGLPAELHSKILGAEAPLWTEFVPNEGHMAYLLFPRAIALAETLWNQPGRKHYGSFLRRLPAVLKNFDRAGYSYRPLDGLLQVEEKAGRVALNTPVSGATIRYTLDGSYPGLSSPVYRQPFENREVRRLRVGVWGAAGNRFPVIERTLGRGDFTVTAPEAYRGYEAKQVFDDDINRFYLSRTTFPVGAELTLTLVQPVRIGGVAVLAAKGFKGGGGLALQKGRLLISEDGRNFREVASFKNGVAEYRAAPHTVLAIRLVADQAVAPQLMVREIALLPAPAAE